MKGRMNTGLGEVTISTDVIATYAGSVAVECFGIVGMAAVNMKAVSYTHLDVYKRQRLSRESRSSPEA